LPIVSLHGDTSLAGPSPVHRLPAQTGGRGMIAGSHNVLKIVRGRIILRSSD
jgi:hypothetical protein